MKKTGLFSILGFTVVCATFFCANVQAQHVRRQHPSEQTNSPKASSKAIPANQQYNSNRRGTVTTPTLPNAGLIKNHSAAGQYKTTVLGPCSDTTTFGNLSVVIPDDDTAGVINSQVISGVTGTLGINVQLKSVCFKIDHTWVGDLIVTLIAPNGTQINLTNRPGVPATPAGCNGDNLDVCVDVGTGNEMESVCNNLPAISGSFTAVNGTNLGDINNAGGSPNGTWQLFASDNVSDDTGSIIEWSLVFDDGPVANWVSPGVVCATGNTINLDQLVTGTPGGVWSGTGVTGNTFNPAGLSGLIAVTYTVTNTGTGCTDTEINNIFVDVIAPVAGFNFTTTSLTANFTNLSTGTTTYAWNFGDGGTSNLENPSHTYAVSGTYTVTLTATNGCGSNVSTQSVTVLGCPDIIVDGSLEGGTPNGSWAEFSTNFQTPICDLGCDPNGINQSRTGDYWAWFGGIEIFEEASLAQNITIAVNSTATLTFWLQMPVCDSPDDFLKVAVDSDTLFTINGGSTLCGSTTYTLQSVNLDVYDDGLPHTLTIISRSYGTNGGVTNMYVDDIALIVCTGIGFNENILDQQVSVMPVPARDFINVNFKDVFATNVKIEIADMLGKNIFNSTIPQINDDQSERIDVSGWNKGVYLLKIISGDNSVNRKIIVQ